MFRLSDFRLVRSFVLRERRSYAIGAVLVALTSLFVVTVPKVIGAGVECITTGIRMDRLSLLCLALIGVVLLRGITSFWMRQVIIGASRRIEFALRNRLFRHLQSLDASYFARFHTGDLMSRFTSDVDAVRMSIGPGVMYLTNTVFTSILALIVMFSVSPRLTAYSMVPLILLTIVIRLLGPRVHRESMAAQERLAEVSVHAQENFSNARVVKAFVREEVEVSRMANLSDRYFAQNMRLARTRSLTHALLWLFGDLLVLVLLAVGGIEIIESRIELAEFVIFKGCQMLLIWPMIALGWVMTIFQRGAASAKRLTEVLDAKPKINDSRVVPTASSPLVPHHGVSFRGVSFTFDDSSEATLHDITFDLPEGGTLGVVGPTGSGKTTLLNLVARIYDPTTGAVSLGGRTLPGIPLDELTNHIGVVPQEAFLFSTTIERNVALGSARVDDRLVHEAATVVRIHDEITEFRHGYRQRVGERGITLSGGQKQRIALARALIQRPPVLILDDVLSAVDADTEASILDGLANWTDEQTVLIASHRISSVRHANLILVLDEGRVVQRGTHDQLTNQPGFYRDLHQRQTLEDELENL